MRACGHAKSNQPPGRAPVGWSVVVRLNDGRRLYYSTSRDAQGQAEWTPRLNQAERFATRAEADRLAAAMQTNSAAMEYEVVRLPQA